MVMSGVDLDTFQLTWDNDDMHLDVILNSKEDEWFFLNRKTQEVEEGLIKLNLDHFIELLSKIIF